MTLYVKSHNSGMDIDWIVPLFGQTFVCKTENFGLYLDIQGLFSETI